MNPRRLSAWIALTALGFAIGTTLSVTLVGATARPLGSVLGGMVFIALFGAVIGFVIGAAQYAGLPHDAVSLRAWLLANVVGAAAGFVVAAPVGEVLGNLVDPTGNIVIGGATIQISSGAMLGLGIGIAQARVLRRLTVSRWWVIASAIGVGLGWGAATAVLELLEVPILKVSLIPAFGAIVGLIAGIAQGLVLRRRPRIVRE